ncbi:MAG: hypothetical protein H6832_01690 [Planctomycetes bacterium]|nr:hypothetical protein [Planctomycetota bacterium]MCB9917099.1 hypothetical protein [Planctomycetota bacterium]
MDVIKNRFASGVLAGLLLGAGIGWIAFGSPVVGTGRAELLDTESVSRIAELEGELAQLRQRVIEQGDVRNVERGADGSAPAEPASVETTKRVSRDAIDAFLLAELDRLLAGDAIRLRFAGDRKGLFEFLVTTWLAAGRPELACSVVLACAGELDVWKEALAAGEALLAAGNRTLATEAFLLVFAREPYRVMNHLRDLAPDRALAMLDDPSLKDQIAFMPRIYGRIRMLAALGRTDDVIAYVDDLSRRGDLPRDSWRDIVEAAPSFAESRLRALIESGPADDRPWYELRLVDAIDAQGRTAEATAIVEKKLAQGFDTLWLDSLIKIAPEKALRYLEDRSRQMPGDALTLNYYAKELASAGRRAEAFATYEKSLAVRFESGIASRLLEIDAVRAATVLSPLVQRDDEALGNIGDALWEAGHPALARSYWEHALRVDPSDREWKRKLDRVRAGADPFDDQ